MTSTAVQQKASQWREVSVHSMPAVRRRVRGESAGVAACRAEAHEAELQQLQRTDGSNAFRSPRHAACSAHDKAAASQHHLDNRNIAPLTTRRLSATVLKS